MSNTTHNRLDNTRVVTFKESYSAGGKVLYKKDEVAYIHKDTADKIKKNGGKVDVKEFDIKAEVSKAKKVFGREADK